MWHISSYLLYCSPSLFLTESLDLLPCPHTLENDDFNIAGFSKWSSSRQLCTFLIMRIAVSASASAAFPLLRSRHEYLADGLERRDVPALRVPNHLNKCNQKSWECFSISFGHKGDNFTRIGFSGCYLVIFVQIIGCVPSDRNKGYPWKPQICPEKCTDVLVKENTIIL